MLLSANYHDRELNETRWSILLDSFDIKLSMSLRLLQWLDMLSVSNLVVVCLQSVKGKKKKKKKKKDESSYSQLV